MWRWNSGALQRRGLHAWLAGLQHMRAEHSQCLLTMVCFSCRLDSCWKIFYYYLAFKKKSQYNELHAHSVVATCELLWRQLYSPQQLDYRCGCVWLHGLLMNVEGSARPPTFAHREETEHSLCFETNLMSCYHSACMGVGKIHIWKVHWQIWQKLNDNDFGIIILPSLVDICMLLVETVKLLLKKSKQKDEEDKYLTTLILANAGNMHCAFCSNV